MRCVLASALVGFAALAAAQPDNCPNYAHYSSRRNEPPSIGRHKLAYQRPTEQCRTFTAPIIEETIKRVKGAIADPDLARLFENTFPNTLDTAIRWTGLAENTTDEELTFIITGDIPAMWLRDSANQLQPYAPLLTAEKNDTLAALFRGAINLQARYMTMDAYCNAFQAPAESGISPQINAVDTVFPGYDLQAIYQCSYQLDSLAAFLQLSVDYHNATSDTAFFGKHNWVAAVDAVMKVALDMMEPTYESDATPRKPPYTFVYCVGYLANSGVGNPVNAGAGLIRSAFRPSDDPCIYQYFIPANMMFATYLGRAAEIMTAHNRTLAERMNKLSASVREAIERHGIVNHPIYGRMYAYEVDGYGSVNIMDDANTPSLLSAPMHGYMDARNQVYKNTRKMVLGKGNPYWNEGPLIHGVGSPHTGLGMTWPMASIVRIMTSDDDTEISEVLAMLVRSTDGLGLMHESVSPQNAGKWSRQW